MDLRALLPIASGVLTGLATQILVSAPGWTVRKLRRSAEGTALVKITADAVTLAFADASTSAAVDDDLAWVEAVAREWQPAFTPAVCTQLLAALSGVGDAAAFRAAARHALDDDGADLTELGRVIDAEEFLYALPRRLFTGLRTAALTPDSAIRDIVDALLQQETAAAVEAAVSQASPREFRQDLAGLLEAIEAAATSAGLPRFAALGAEIMEMTGSIRVRAGIRPEPREKDNSAPDPYALAADRIMDERPVLDWQAAAAHEDRVVVLGDPGTGKSWLIRWETVRFARAAQDVLSVGASVDQVIVPVPVRCDELVLAKGSALPDAICSYLASRYDFPARSQHRLHRHITDGGIMLLLDALDELPGRAARQHLDSLLGPWIASPRARFRITSRIAGYTSIPALLSSVTEFELQPFTSADVSALITAWGLPAGLAARLREQLNDRPLAEIAQIPLIAALLCATAHDSDDLPGYTAGIYERVLRRFLAQENRWPHAPELEPTQIDQLIGILAPLAFHFATRPEGWTDRMPATQILTVMRSLGPVFTELGRDAATVLRDLSVRAGVLVPAGAQHTGHNPPYLFLHRTIAEYLVAQHLASMPREDWLAVLRERMWFDTDWRPVLSMLGAAFVQQGRHGDFVFLITFLLDQDHDPLSQALYLAVRATAELPGPHLLPPELASQIAGRMFGLLDSEPERDPGAELLGRYLDRLPWNFTQALLTRLDTTTDWVVPQILANSRDPRVVSRLVATLDKGTDQVFDVYTALRQQDAECYADEMLARFHDPRQRHQAACVLGSITAPRVTSQMLEYIGDSDASIRLHALEVIRSHPHQGIFEALRRCSTDIDPDIRLITIDGLAASNAPASDQVLQALTEDPDSLVRLQAFKTIIPAEATPLARILAFARNPDSYARSLAADALIGLPSSPEITATLIELTNAPEAHVRNRATWSLARHPSPEAAAALVRLLDDEHCAKAASRALHSYDDPAVTRMIWQWLGASPEPDRQITAMEALSGSSSPDVTRLLIGALTDTADVIREAATYALAGRTGRDVAAALLTSLEDSSPQVRHAAVLALQDEASEPDVSAALLRRLHDEDSEVRRAAVSVLQISDLHPQVTSALIGLLADVDLKVRDIAAAKLEEATTPAALLDLCTPASQLSARELPLPRTTVERLANRVYKSVRASERQLVIQELAGLRLTARAPQTRPHTTPHLMKSNWTTYGFGKRVTPDLVTDDLLDIELVVLLQGSNLLNGAVYSYIKLMGSSLKRLFAAMHAGKNFTPSDYGHVLFADLGVPAPEVREVMRVKYNMIDVPVPPV